MKMRATLNGEITLPCTGLCQCEDGLACFTRDCGGLLGFAGDYLIILGITWDYWGLIGISGNYLDILGITWDYWGFFLALL